MAIVAPRDYDETTSFADDDRIEIYDLSEDKNNYIKASNLVGVLPVEYDISSSNELITLPAITGAPQERTYFWSNGGTYKIQFQDADLNVSEYEGEGEGHIKFVSTGTAWKVTEYEDKINIADSGSDYDRVVLKRIDKTLRWTGKITGAGVTWLTSNYGYTIDTTDAVAFADTINNTGAFTAWRNLTTTTIQTYYGGAAALAHNILIEAMW